MKNEGIVLEKQRSSRNQQQRLSDLDFADDIAMIDESEQRLQHTTSEVEEKGRKVGFTINSKKTKFMDAAKERNDITTTLSNQNSLENVDKFVYLRSTISHNSNLTPELDNRIGKQRMLSTGSYLSCATNPSRCPRKLLFTKQ